MTSKAFGLAQLGNAFNDGALSNRNLIINGAMQVWQRGTSFSGYNNYSADRWKVSVSTVPTSNTVDRVQEGNKSYARWQCTMPSGHLALFHQRIEGNPLAGKTVTVSFSAKGSGTLSKISFDQITGGVNSEVVAATNVVLSATEERYSFTTQLPSIASVPLATDQTRVQFFCDGSSSPVDMYITEVQLEVGDTATPFEHRSYGQELALCQRYYKCGSTRLCFSEVPGRYGFAQVDAHQYRTTPSCSYTFTSSGYGTVLAVGSFQPSGTTYTVDVQTAPSSGMDGIINWTADAEL